LAILSKPFDEINDGWFALLRIVGFVGESRFCFAAAAAKRWVAGVWEGVLLR
jgi:hypothetical protein